MTFNNSALGVLVIAFGGAIILQAWAFPEIPGMAYGPDFFPILIGIGFCLCGLSLLGSALLPSAGTIGPWVTWPAWFGDRGAVVRGIAVIVAVLFYALLVDVLGFLLTVFVITAGLFGVLGAPRLVAVLVSLLLPPILHYGFSVALRVPLPRGILERLFF
ncbi:MAG: tripartite tricarboxylate transporter TctB family protein [Geminicoccaceae bacterium]